MKIANTKEESKRQKAIKERIRKEYIKAFRHVMSSQEGRWIVHDLLTDSGFFDNAFTGNSATFYKIGKQELGRKMFHLINDHCLEEYVQMKKEAESRKLTHKQEIENV